MQNDKLILKKNNFLIIFTGVVAIAGIFLTVFLIQKHDSEKSIVDNLPAASVDDFKTQPVASIENITTPLAQVPSSFLLSAPFQSQAPYADWNEPYENACEEASIIIVEHYLKNQSLSKDQMKSEINSAVSWQIKNWGEHSDLNADKTLKFAQSYFHLSGKVIQNYSVDDIKKYISNCQPVLAPTAGRKLGNPNFTGAGPEYHMIVIIGYDDSRQIFITNDPGTRKGEKYIYKYQTVLSAISGPKEDLEKAVIILDK